MSDGGTEQIVALFGEPSAVEIARNVHEAPLEKGRTALDVSVLRFDRHLGSVAYVTAGLASPSSPQKSVGGAQCEIVFCVPTAVPWAAPVVLALAQLSLGYELTGTWSWGSLRKCAASMGQEIDLGRHLRDAYDGLRFVAYRPSAAFGGDPDRGSSRCPSRCRRAVRTTAIAPSAVSPRSVRSVCPVCALASMLGFAVCLLAALGSLAQQLGIGAIITTALRRVASSS